MRLLSFHFVAKGCEHYTTPQKPEKADNRSTDYLSLNFNYLKMLNAKPNYVHLRFEKQIQYWIQIH